MSRTRLFEIESEYHAQQMRACRNQVRKFLTHNTRKIDVGEQSEWYHETYRPARERQEMIGYLVRENFDTEPLGYGLITKRDGRYWLGGGLVAAARGKGAGRTLFESMTKTVHEALGEEQCWLDVRKDNAPARALYEKLGYVATAETADLIIMVHQNNDSQPQHAELAVAA